MVAVFSIFATLSEIEFKVFGVAMAAAVLIDATVVRGVLLPAGLALLGDRAWALPGRKGRLPSASPPPGAPEVPGAPGAPEVNVSVRTGSDKDW
jgi:RND superfamily putative drug exporter